MLPGWFGCARRFRWCHTGAGHMPGILRLGSCLHMPPIVVSALAVGYEGCPAAASPHAAGCAPACFVTAVCWAPKLSHTMPEGQRRISCRRQWQRLRRPHACGLAPAQQCCTASVLCTEIHGVSCSPEAAHGVLVVCCICQCGPVPSSQRGMTTGA